MFSLSGAILLLTVLDTAYSQTCGDLGTSVTIRIATAGTGVDVPEFTTVSLGDTVTIQCDVSPMPTTYQWLRNGNVLSQTGRVLRVENIQGVNGGNYSCRANLSTPTCITRESRGFIIQTPPDLTVSSPSSLTVEVQEGSPFRLQCDASGWPIPSVQWRKVGSGVVSSDGDYTVTSASFSDAGAYFCEAVNIVANMTQTRVVQISRLIRTTEMDATEDSGVLPGRRSNETEDQTGFYIGVGVAAGVSAGITVLMVTICLISLFIACRPPPSARNPYEDWPDGQQDNKQSGDALALKGNSPLQGIVIEPSTAEVAPFSPLPKDGEQPDAQEDDTETIPSMMPSKSEIGEMI